MKLTKGFEQATCIMAIVAVLGKDGPVASGVIHKRLEGSETYIRKIIRKLVVADLVKSVSGNNGGYTLAKPAGQISVLDVVEAMEGIVDTFPESGLLARVFNESPQVAQEGEEILHRLFQKADHLWKQQLSNVTVEDIVQELQEKHKLDEIVENTELC